MLDFHYVLFIMALYMPAKSLINKFKMIRSIKYKRCKTLIKKVAKIE